MAYITCRDVSLGYDKQAIIEHLNFQVNAGDYLCIVGENGAGKSTLMNAILGFNHPMAGEVLTGDGLKNNEVGYLPQQTPVQRDFPASVREVVMAGCLNSMGAFPFYRRKEKELANQNMRRMGITELAGKSYRELSGGQQQRVLLARALCATKKILLLDEPVTGLDPKVTEEMYELIARLNREGLTILMVSHDIAAAAKYATHILHLGDHQQFFGKTQDYIDSRAGQEFLAGYRREDG